MRILCALFLFIAVCAQAQITISNATLSGVTSGSALLSGNNTFSGTNIFTAGIVGDLKYPTNALANLTLITLSSTGGGNYAAHSTNDNIVITGLANVDSVATNVQWAVRIFTNTAGTTKTLTLPASFIGVNTTEYLTNQGVLSLVLYPGLGTNAVWRCLK